MKGLQTKLWKGIALNLVILILLLIQGCYKQDAVSLPSVGIERIIKVAEGIHRTMDWRRGEIE